MKTKNGSIVSKDGLKENKNNENIEKSSLIKKKHGK